MEWITIVDWPGGTLSEFDKAHAERGDPDGIVARYCGVVNGDLRIVAVWESRAAAERFFANMPADVAARLAPRTNGVPSVTAFEVERSFVDSRLG